MSQQAIDGSVATVGTAKNWLERMLSIVADVQSGEALDVLLLTIDMFVLLGSYYLLTVRESLILTEGGAEIRTYSSAGQAALLFGIVPLYGWIASHLNRNLFWFSVVSPLDNFWIVHGSLQYEDLAQQYGSVAIRKAERRKGGGSLVMRRESEIAGPECARGRKFSSVLC